MESFHTAEFAKFFAMHSTPERMARGFIIYANGNVNETQNKLIEQSSTRVFLANSLNSDTVYIVRLEDMGTKQFTATCTCPDGIGCKHQVAAAFLVEYANKYRQRLPAAQQKSSMVANRGIQPKQTEKVIEPTPAQDLISSKLETTLTLPDFEPETLWTMIDPAIMADFNKHSEKGFRVYGDVVWADQIDLTIYGFGVQDWNAPEVSMSFAGAKGEIWRSSCTCNRKAINGICVHKFAAIFFLGDKYNYKSGTDIPTKNQVLTRKLAEFGFKPTDDYEKHLKVFVGRNDISVTPKYKGLVGVVKVPDQARLLKFESNTLLAPYDADLEDSKSADTKLFWLLNKSSVGLDLIPVACKVLKTGKLSVSGKKLSPDGLLDQVLSGDASDQDLLRIFKALTTVQNKGYNLTKAHLVRAAQLSADILLKVGAKGALIMGEHQHDKVSVSQIEPIEVLTTPPTIKFVIKRDELVYSFQANIVVNNRLRGIKYSDWYGQAAILQDGNQLHVIQDTGLLNLTGLFAETGVLRSGLGLPLDGFFNQYVTPISIRHEVDTNGLGLVPIQNLLTPVQACLYIKDDADQRLRFIPIFKYQFGDLDAEFGLGGSGKMLYVEKGVLHCHYRDLNWERNLATGLQNIHPAFETQTDGQSFWLSYNQAMHDSWIVRLAEHARSAGWTLLGQKDLQRFKFSLEKPVFELKVSSGIDWFDVVPMLTFGNEVVPIKKIKQAILAGQQYVLLGDGTFGMLPAEWLKKLAPMLRLGKESKTGLRINSNQSHTLQDDEGHTNFGAELDSIITKQSKAFKQLASLEEIPHFELPLSLNATLRPYQQKGYNWLSYHNEIGTGALLADDMGLGKTLQALALLAAGLETNHKAKHLVVMPTSLLFNWEQEIHRFVPELRMTKYYGPSRKIDNFLKAWKNVDVILTTYGTLRSDIDQLEGFKFDMMILDEAHAIKNPDAAVSAAVRRIDARFRVAMTGTPIENRTMDLFSQLDFLNPGLLGTRQSFNEYYANAIDRGKDESMAAELRKLVSPFILRRTKQQVVLDLPPKTETILYTHLLPSQRSLYNATRDEIRENIVLTMREQGRNAAGILILSGLTKLRQICASAAIIRPEMANTKDHSAKLDLLIEELQNTTENYKVLVFSNFLGMLSLIADQLKANDIGYCYMDGSTSNRQEVVEAFKQDDSKRVFLMTLKTGGVGLNLTEAEYVYIIDPWWNPAAEQQAIDRTHRIGQSAPIFAYKLIAVDTIEEKIIELQKRKLKIATDLISTDEGVLGQLSDSEVVALFD